MFYVKFFSNVLDIHYTATIIFTSSFCLRENTGNRLYQIKKTKIMQETKQNMWGQIFFSKKAAFNAKTKVMT